MMAYSDRASSVAFDGSAADADRRAEDEEAEGRVGGGGAETRTVDDAIEADTFDG